MAKLLGIPPSPPGEELKGRMVTVDLTSKLGTVWHSNYDKETCEDHNSNLLRLVEFLFEYRS